jgi:hypothetical protein
MSQLRISVWPGTPVEVPAVPSVETAEVNVPGILDLVPGGPDRQLPPEFFLRELFELGLDDESLADACSAVGLLCPQDTKYVEVLPYVSWADFDLLPSDPREAPPSSTLYAEMARLTVRVARALVDHWAVHTSTMRRKQAAIVHAWRLRGFNQPESVEEAWTLWSDYLNAALRPFHVRVSTGQGTAHAVVPTVYSCVALQLANAVNDGLPPHECANETCQRRFIRQSGDSGTQHVRSRGVIYCSMSCARAQNNREYRRRQRKKGPKA